MVTQLHHGWRSSFWFVPAVIVLGAVGLAAGLVALDANVELHWDKNLLWRSVLAKAWEEVERIGSRARWQPRRVLVTGAGPVGLLAALMAVQRGLEVHVLDRLTEGPKPGLVRDLGATYHTGTLREASNGADIVIECTGAGQLVFDAMEHTAPGGIVCLTGISSGGRALRIDAGMLNRTLVLENDVVFGSVNANRRHYEEAAGRLAKADRDWLERLMTRRVPLERWSEGINHQPADVKTVIELTT
jgi:threonine dehydrogenase-like Zn-dependent dehydrogenase